MMDLLIFHISYAVAVMVTLAVFFLIALGLALILTKRTFKGLANEYYIGIEKAIHSWIGWLVVPFFKGFFNVLRARGKLKFHQQEPIPWEEKPLFITNHPCPELQDVFIDLVEVFLLRPQNFFNPVAFFPPVPAEKNNFTNKWYGGAVKLCTISLDRHLEASEARALLIALRHIENGGTIIGYIEGGRTQNALRTSKSPKGNVMGEFTDGAAYLSLKTNRPIVVLWKRIDGCENIPAGKVNFSLLTQGMLRLCFHRKVRMFYDFGVVIRPDRTVNLGRKREREAAISAYNKRIKEAFFITADRQSDRLNGSGSR